MIVFKKLWCAYPHNKCQELPERIGTIFHEHVNFIGYDRLISIPRYNDPSNSIRDLLIRRMKMGWKSPQVQYYPVLPEHVDLDWDTGA